MSKHPDNELLSRWRDAAGDKKIVLHVGDNSATGTPLYPRYQADDWHEIRVHTGDETNADLHAPLYDLSAIPNGSIDAIWVRHTIEFLNGPQLAKALAECHRVLKEGGEMGACVPDLPAIAAHVAHGRIDTPLYKTPSGKDVRALDLIHGVSQGVVQQQSFTAEHLVGYARASGMTAITVMRKELHLWLGSFKFPEGHPKHVEKARVLADKLPEMPPTPPLAQQNHPGLLHKGKMADELDVPPKMWDMA